MSRIGKQPVVLPAGVKVEVKDGAIEVAGPKGNLSQALHALVKIVVDGAEVKVERDGDSKAAKSLHGLYRSLVANMVEGVTKGFERKLEIHGVGYGAKFDGKTAITLTVGFSKPVKVPIPDGVTVKLPDATRIEVTGSDKQKVGQFAAVVRAVRKPEPYKQTGIRYAGEVVRKKAGKAFGAGAGK